MVYVCAGLQLCFCKYIAYINRTMLAYARRNDTSPLILKQRISQFKLNHGFQLTEDKSYEWEIVYHGSL